MLQARADQAQQNRRKRWTKKEECKAAGNRDKGEWEFGQKETMQGIEMEEYTKEDMLAVSPGRQVRPNWATKRLQNPALGLCDHQIQA